MVIKYPLTNPDRCAHCLYLHEGIQLGKQEGEFALVMRLIKRKFGTPDRELISKIASLNLEQLESLGEELFDFITIDDLYRWLE